MLRISAHPYGCDSHRCMPRMGHVTPARTSHARGIRPGGRRGLPGQCANGTDTHGRGDHPPQGGDSTPAPVGGACCIRMVWRGVTPDYRYVMARITVRALPLFGHPIRGGGPLTRGTRSQHPRTPCGLPSHRFGTSHAARGRYESAQLCPRSARGAESCAAPVPPGRGTPYASGLPVRGAPCRGTGAGRMAPPRGAPIGPYVYEQVRTLAGVRGAASLRPYSCPRC